MITGPVVLVLGAVDVEARANIVICTLDGDATMARSVLALDNDLDQMNRQVHKAMILAIQQHPEWTEQALNTIIISRNLERIGDHATNIAEIVHFEITGEEMTGERPKWDALQRRGELLEGPLVSDRVNPMKREGPR